MASKIYGLDTETDNDGTTAWMVQWALVDKDGHGKAGTEYEDLKQTFLDLLDKEQKTYVYIHNADYDMHFIKGILYEISDEYKVKMKITARYGKIISWILRPTEDSPFEGGEIIFRDSAKKIPGSSVRSLGELIGLPKLEGVSEDFHPGWSKEVDFSDPKEWLYVRRDAQIVAAAMSRMHSRAGGGRNKSTASGDAWMLMKKYIGTDPRTGKRYKNDMKWQKLFPRLDTELDMRLRRGYMGGLNISMMQGLHEGVITHEDVHSMYPTVMSYDPLPYGLPTMQFHCPRDGALYIVETRIKLRLKEGMFPWFQFKNVYDNQIEGWEYGTLIEETYQWHELTLTNVDLDILMDWYDVEFDQEYPHTYFVFMQKTGVFAGYIEHYMEQKERAEKGSLEYTSAKLAMNSGYGRMALARETEDTVLEWDDEIGDFMLHSSPTINDETENYLPYAMFVTAYARARLLENCLQLMEEGKQILHCDTDSVIHLDEESEEMDHGDYLGGWGIECRPLKIYEGGFKRYIEILHEPVQSLKDINVTCAGVPQRINHLGVAVGTWVELLDDPQLITTSSVLGHEDYHIKSEWLRMIYEENGMDPDHVNTMKLIPRKVPGGVILEPRQHTLSDNMSWRLRR
jgi:hypothetical protein